MSEKSQSRAEAMGEETRSPTAMETPAGSEHSQLPWYVSRTSRQRGNGHNWWLLSRDSAFINRGSINRLHDAEFIVRAVNAHDELVAALAHLVAEVTGFIGISEIELREIAGNTNVAVLLARLDEARIALAKAGGR
jgi:hypothetical protein